MSKTHQLESLIRILEKSDINSLEVSSFWGFRKIRLSKGKVSAPNYNQSNVSNELERPSSVTNDSNVVKQATSSQNSQESQDVIDSDLFIQKAPLVGTVYLSPKPEDPPFVSEGDYVKKGQKLCLIEAMKIFNEIEAEEDGTICEILVGNEDPVEFGQSIFKIKP